MIDRDDRADCTGEDDCECDGCRRDAHHTCIYVGVDDRDECETCGRSLDSLLLGRPDHERADWDGAV